jgi:DNA modification methylase
MKSKQTENIKATSLIADDKNFNKGSENGAEMIRKSFEKFGAGRSILLDKNNRIIAGNKSVEFSGIDDVLIVESDGTQLIAVKRTDIDLDSPQGREMALADNASAKANIVFDAELIEAELGEAVCVEWGIDVATKLEAKEDDFEVPADGIETDIVLGDLFEIGEHRLLCGDSTDSDQVAKLMNGQKADMVFTDPPFPNNSEIMHDMIKNIDGAFNNSRLFCDGLMIWFWDNLQFPPFLEMVTSKHIWHKTNGWQAGHFETMYCYHNDKNRHEQKVFSVNNVGGENNRKEQGNHPTPKPISLISDILNDISKKSKIILDLFLGSGTTMVAAHKLKRKCYGMELDCKYVEVIVQRMIKLDKTLVIKRNGVEETKKWIDKLG